MVLSDLVSPGLMSMTLLTHHPHRVWVGFGPFALLL